MIYYFDMDGTIADLYGVENWLEDLQAEESRPFDIAPPFVDMQELSEALNQIQSSGRKIGVISWLPMNATTEYKEVVRRSKRKWLQRHLPEVLFDHVHFIQYGTNKSRCNKAYENGILFDDNQEVLDRWNGRAVHVKEPENILELIINIDLN